MRPLHSRLALAALLAVAFAPARAADTALTLVPADAAFCSSSLRLGEQMDRFLKSKAYARLRELPAAKFVVQQMRQELAKPENPVGQFLKTLEEPANRELVDLLRDAVRQEIFVYGGGDWSDFGKVLMEVNSANRFGPLMAMLRGENPQRAQMTGIVRALNAAGDKFHFPEFVIGFRLSKTGPVAGQMKRLEELLVKVTAETPLKGRVKRVQVGGADALTFSVDGSLLPLDKVPEEQDEATAAELKKLFAKLKTLKLTASLLVKNDYLLLAVGPDTGAAEKFGRSPGLTTRPELRPLAQYTDKPLIAVDYVSAAFLSSFATTAEDVTGLADLAKAALTKAPISEPRKAAIEKDLQQMARELTAALPKPGAMAGFTFLTPRGSEAYHYDYGAAPEAASGSLTLLQHVGGTPLVAFAGRATDPTPGYQWLVKWLKVIYGHAEEVMKETVPPEQQQQIRGGLDLVLPILRRFDEITSTMLLPSLGAGEVALVADAKWTSKKWFPPLDQHGQELPLVELACVRTVKDPALYVKAWQSYRELANEVLAKARQFGAPVPEGGVPKPESRKVGAATLYYWPVPAMGQDAQLQPNLGLSDKVAVGSFSFKHAERLLTPTSLKAEGVLAERRPLLSAAVVDFAGFIGAVRPWVEKFALPMALEHAPAEAPAGLRKEDIPAQVATVLDVLQCLKGFRSVTYREGNATVTHTETEVRDLP